MNLQKNQTLSGFSVIDIVDLAEMRATGIWAKHQKTGVEVFHVLNDDSENLFTFAFATSPEDNTGAAHILEHTVLCGSERYPLKDAFMVLAQGSLQTFLNAITFPDKTVYPASSVNEHDYFNLMSVYGDAVFRPRLCEWAFMQEGHRFEFEKNTAQTDRLSVTGVVFNEMKGAYSQPDSYTGHWSVKSVMPDTPYAFDSGGDPEYISQLSWEGLKNFHRNRYSPANCRIFLAGNIPTEKQLAFLDEHFFSSMERGTAAPPVAVQKRWAVPKEFRIPCPGGGDIKPTVFLSWLCTDIAETGENIALTALAEILLGHDGSPLTRALIESGLGEDITPVSGFEGEIRETLFTAGLRGVGEKTNVKQIEELILGELRRLVTEGIPRDEIEAALHYMEFSLKEIRRSGGPFSLVWMRRSLRSWLHGGKPWETLLLEPAMEELKQNIAKDNRFFESLIEKYFLNNPHRALVMMEPQKDFLPKQEERFAEELAKTEQGFSDADRERVIEKSASLEKIQNKRDRPEALATIPHLSRKDLVAEPEIIPRRPENLRGIPALCHDLHTNGITYADLAFPLDILPGGDYEWIPFFAQAVTSVGLPGMGYAEVSSLLARTVGGFKALLHTGSAYPGNAADSSPKQPLPGELQLTDRDWIIYRIKCLDEKTAAALDLALRLISEADFSDERRLRDLVLEMKNELHSGFAPYGHNYASCRASRMMSRSRQVEETWNGLSQIEFAHRLAEMNTAEIAAKLKYLRDAIAGGGLVANLAGCADALKSGGTLLAEKFGRFGAPRHCLAPGKTVNGMAAGTAAGAAPAPEVFASPSLQIGFAAVTLRAAAYDTPAQVAETVLAHRYSTDILMEEIRMKGGAYGAMTGSDGLERCFAFSTYRDPDPLRSLDTFASILKNGTGDFISDDEVEKMIIGCYARETHPRSPSEKSFIDLLRFFSRIDDGCRRRKLERLIAASAAEAHAARKELAAQNPAGRVIIAGTKYAQKAAEALGVTVQTLPV